MLSVAPWGIKKRQVRSDFTFYIIETFPTVQVETVETQFMLYKMIKKQIEYKLVATNFKQ